MKKVSKYISVCSLWLAGLIMVAHLIIPHDHHLAGSYSNPDISCPASKNESRHHTGFPVHCHAFNDLASDKVRPIQFFQNIQNTAFILHNFSSSPKIALQVFYVTIFDLQEPVLNSFALDLALLRAPPLSA
jgi:hypothetical protein